MNIAFLVYDSRSGSTLLSREISEAFDQVFVTPEIGFDRLFALGERGLIAHGWENALNDLFSGHEFINFDVPYNRALELVQGDDGPLNIVDGIHSLLGEFVHLHGHEKAKWVIIKNGSHIRYWKEINKLFKDDFFLLHIVRDPRAVINSKLRTKRPYHSGEVMAWAGVLPAAIRWKQYVNDFHKASILGVKTHQVRYENLVNNLDEILMNISVFLSIPFARSKKTFYVPDSEKSIHELVLEKGMNKARAEAWSNELNTVDCYRIESLCEKEMTELGYICTGYIGTRTKITLYIYELPSISFKVIRHVLLILKESYQGYIK